MAEEKEKTQSIDDIHKKTAREIIEKILLAILLISFLGGLFNTLSSSSQTFGDIFKNGWRGLTPKALALSGTRPLASVLNPINGRVLVSNEKGTDVYNEVLGKKIGTQKFGAYGRVLRGPVSINGEKYFYVDFESGVDGWVKESDLNYKDATIRPLKKDDPLGSEILASKDTPVLNEPNGESLGYQPKGAKGVIKQGPIEKDGKTYFYVDFENGVDGWVLQENLSLYDNGTRYLNEKDGIGTSVVAKNDGVKIYDENGNEIGSLKNGENKKIKKGPVYINGEKYWYVEFDDGQSGFVKESDLLVKTKREKNFGEKILNFFEIVIIIFKYLLILACIYFVFWIWRIIKKLTNIRKNVREKLYPVSNEVTPSVNPKWARVLNHLESQNEGEWRLSIIEADIMLDELLSVMGLQGETIGDKLKSVEKSDFNTLDLAWEAHKIRNKIAHDGADFGLTQREARRVVSLYEAVFKEFSFI